jgi:hypothetical protein
MSALLSFDTTLDRREAILERLVDIGQGISGIASVYRNHGPTQTGVLGVQRPAFLLFDGGARLTQDVTRHKAVSMPPTIWRMDPQIVILLENRDTVENLMVDGVQKPVGQEISGWMKLVKDTVTNDVVLLDLVTPNGTHFMSSFETDLKVGRTVGAYGAWLMMLYEFYYPLFPPR